MNLSGNTILITGGGSGIGLALAKEFLQRDNLVIICGRDAGRLHAAKKKFQSLEIIQCDISNEGSVSAMLEKIEQNYPDLNFLVNNAGIMKMWNIQHETTNTRNGRYPVCHSQNFPIPCPKNDPKAIQENIAQIITRN